ncbi:MAG TPA: ectonucleotide pyrophosphatase/phosphodiesterase [Bryobacteraceae bacterium]|nr:ectonucleotide pyrophosphatase/phosphodiesterase [Bryobacteraceae bacterium]
MRLFFAALVLPAVLAAQPVQKLLIISIDGFDARFLSNPALRVKMPNTRRLMRDGASATVIGVAPSDSWPSHASIVTGVAPWQHGVVANARPGAPGQRFFESSSIKTETLWDAATKKGLRTATIYWPGTVGAGVAFDFPEYWEERQGNAIPMAPIAQKSTPAGIIDRVSQMFPPFDKQLWDDSSSADAALYLLSSEKADVVFVHMAEADAEQHDTGALSIYAREILENDDDMIGQILAKAAPGTLVALVSDHGFENSLHIVRPRVLLQQAGVRGRVEVEDGLIGTGDLAVADALRKLVGLGRKSGIAREVRMSEVKSKAPSLARWVAAFDTLPDYIPSNEDRGAGVGPGTHLGVHGLWPTRPGYRSVFILAGTGVHSVKLGEIDMLQIAPTLAEAIGVKLPAAKAGSLWPAVSR